MDPEANVREFSRPSITGLPAGGNLTDDVVRNGKEHANAISFLRNAAGAQVGVTACDFLSQVRAVAKGLIALGVQPGDRVALMSRTRYEWTLVDYAIWFAGAVTVPLYDTSASDQIEWILSDCAPRAVIVETSEHRRRVSKGRSGIRRSLDVLSIEDGALDGLADSGRVTTDAELERRRSGTATSGAATIIYTSGTTGRAKGCMLTHGNFMAQVDGVVHDLSQLFAQEGASTVLTLPLAHVLARLIQVSAVRERVTLGYSASTQTLLEDLQDQRPSFILGVPRIFETIFTLASQNAAADGRGAMFHRATQTAIRYSEAMDSGSRPLSVRAQHALFERLVYGRVRESLGGRCQYAVSGGAPLGERLGHFYRGVGLTLLEGYGLTESTAALCANSPSSLKVGTVGQPLPGTELRLREDGELMARGDQIFPGYWGDPEATRDVLDEDGWLHTGDLAEIDNEGFVRITGRKREILITAGGKNVAPAVLEERVRDHPLVGQCMVVGDGQPFVGALITLEPQDTAEWAVRHGKSPELDRLVHDADVRAEIQKAVDDANSAVSRAESIREFRLLPSEWTEESGHLTPSLKLRRHAVARDFRRDIDDLYR